MLMSGQGGVRGVVSITAAATTRTAGAARARAAWTGCSTKREVHCRADRSAQVKAMEVEVKIRLPDRGAYDKVAQALAAGLKVTHEQENFFFDGSKKELNSQRAVLRLRFYDVDKKAVITVKGKQILENGIGRASEVEEPVEAVAARRYLDNPSMMLQESPLLKGLNEKLGLQDLVCMGGFRNRRQEYIWEGLTLELDETYFEHGTLYEIECETDDPVRVRDKLEKFLEGNSISYSYSGVSKFANFINRSLL